jgi:hypothetical protein
LPWFMHFVGVQSVYISLHREHLDGGWIRDAD